MAMLRFAGVTAQDVVYDLGCGDGRIIHAAAKHFGARGVGVDIDPLRIQESRERASRLHVSDKTRFLCQSFFDVDLRDASVVMLYLLPAINARLRPKLLGELRPGTRIVANCYEIGGWEPDMRAHAHHRELMQWVVPATVNGAWRCLIDGSDGRHQMILKLQRHFQVVTGTAVVGRREAPLLNGRLFGDQLTFKLASLSCPQIAGRYSCRVEEKFMRGSCRKGWSDGECAPWGGVWRHA
jgi:SAM-dependent methyltransferase